ncbi:hypothetical protein [Hymenobacter lapidiphilus]|uniref:Uncharacterized protein n=1 Tax=Hymenobacter lapidiphilus TaxID=2608003 RepID=A0A7Y7PRX0_9BACT|nr:hypothetical protein [Hymenobacter lapidiphilus]NVO32906.1 hypothetical protein [Hymenobacter lapidiphilus]
MMRIFLLASILLISGLMLEARAQTGDNTIIIGPGEPGYYILTDNRIRQYPARLKVYASQLVAKDEQGKVSKWKPEEVYYVRTAKQRFIALQDFSIKNTFGYLEIKRPVFVQLLDSGTFCLMRYDNGYLHDGSRLPALLLARTGAEERPLTIPYDASSGIGKHLGAGKKFREALAPYVTTRPDLLQLLDEKKISIDNLAFFVRAINTGRPFDGPIAKPSDLD